MGERRLRWVIGEYVKHHHQERNQQGIRNELIEPSGGPGGECVACRQRLGGLLRYYYRRAA
jgi:putative transposase